MERVRTAFRLILAVAMIAIGLDHFVSPDFFVRIVPRVLPAPLLLVQVSGFFEMLGGLGLLAPWKNVRRAAGIGLVALYVAVFPANVNMVRLWKDKPLPMRIGAIARLPLQIPMMRFPCDTNSSSALRSLKRSSLAKIFPAATSSP